MHVGTPYYTYTSHHPYILCHFANYALCLLFVVIEEFWKAVGWVVMHEQVVHVDVHGEVMLWVAATELLLSMADVVCLGCRSCECMSSAESVWQVETSVNFCCC